MSQNRTHLSNDEFEAHADALEGVESLELYVLKAHLLCETALKRCLAKRLSVTEDQLPPLTFETLARLTILGLSPDADRLLVQVKLLNSLRNELAHRLNPANCGDKVRDFVLQGFTGGTWSDNEAEQMLAFRQEMNYFIGFMQALGGFVPVDKPQAKLKGLPKMTPERRVGR